jgi:uncharacterized protein (TIGR00255 family)
MTGFGTAEAEIAGSKFRIELRSVNHRFLDLKVRLPREFQSLESQSRALVQSRFNRGALELKMERSASDITPESEPTLDVNEARARDVFHAYQKLAKIMGSTETPSLRDLALFPEVIRTRGAEDIDLQAAWKENLEPGLARAMGNLLGMRETEGAQLARIQRHAVSAQSPYNTELGRMRKSSEGEFKRRISERVTQVFESHPLPAMPFGEAAARQLLESRIAQELALVIDRTDIQEELVRFEGHLAHFEKTLAEGGAVGRKLEFILQELGREINTLGNKAQDLGISEQVVSVKVRLEQLREQVLNLE